MSDLHKKLLKDNPQFRGLPPRTPPVSSATSSSSYSRRAERNKRDYSVIPWTKYFDSTREVLLESGNKFRVYIKGDAGPVFFFLHGGGFSGLSWSLLSTQLVKRIKCQCYAIDIRGHGDTETNDDVDLSIDTMSNDIKQVVAKLWENAECPPIILIGHSMGGALAAHVAARNYIESLVALCVIDVVEGSALDALSSMQAFLQGRPKMFNSVEQAIEYSIRSGSIKNVESARVSIVGQLKKYETAIDPESGQTSMPANLGSQSGLVMKTELTEEDEEESEKAPRVPVFNLEDVKNKTDSDGIQTPNANITEKYVWRIDLTKTEKYWKEWFKGLSLMFLGVSVPKLLLLAGVDRLDKDLTVGQMQGKFQMQVLPQCGHAVHEDSPDEVAEALATFVIRHKFTESVDGGLYQSTPSFMSQLRMRP